MKILRLLPLLGLLFVAGCTTAGSRNASVKPIRVLIVGGNTSHDFDRWFNRADSATLSELKGVTTEYTEETDSIVERLGRIDVLYLSNNKAFQNPATREAILRFADQGKGLMLVHAAVWYSWKEWPEYNRFLAGGGSRGHDRLGEFQVTVTNPNHPLTKDVAGQFSLSDELYWFEPDPKGTAIEVLATARSKQKNNTYPMVFEVRHPKARIAGITLGHDASAHEHPAYRQLLQNALLWTARRN